MKSTLSIVAIALMVAVSGCSQKPEKVVAQKSSVEKARADVTTLNRSDAESAAKQLQADAEARNNVVAAQASVDAATKSLADAKAADPVDAAAVATAEKALTDAQAALVSTLEALAKDSDAVEAKLLTTLASTLRTSEEANEAVTKAKADLAALNDSSDVVALGNASKALGEANSTKTRAEGSLKDAQEAYKSFRAPVVATPAVEPAPTPTTGN